MEQGGEAGAMPATGIDEGWSDAHSGGGWSAGFGDAFPDAAAVWGLLGALDMGDALAVLRMALLYARAFCQVAAAELYAFATADTCDGTFAALFFGALCAYLLIVRNRDLQRERDGAAPAPAPVTISPALAGQAFWDKYDEARGWQSSIASADKTKHLAGGRNKYSRPLDALLPRREYVPKKRAWEGSGTANTEGVHAPLLNAGRATDGAVAEQPSPRTTGETDAPSPDEDAEQPAEVEDWERTRLAAADAPEVWSVEEQYDQWRETYAANFKKPGSLAAAGILLDPLGKTRGLLEVNRQFYRDVTSGDMVRLQGRPVPSRDDMEAAIKDAKRRLRGERQISADISDKFEHHVARYAWEGVVECVRGDVALAHELASVANQNLGIACYEHVVHHFSAAGGAEEDSIGASTTADDVSDVAGDALAVLQTGEHFVDISYDGNGGGGGDAAAGGRGEVRVLFQGLFKVVPFSLLDGLGTDALGSLVRAVVATAELRLVLGAEGEGRDGGAGLLLAECTARFAIRRPVAVVMSAPRFLSISTSSLRTERQRDNNGIDVEQKARITVWLAEFFGGTRKNPAAIGGPGRDSTAEGTAEGRPGSAIAMPDGVDKIPAHAKEEGREARSLDQSVGTPAGGPTGEEQGGDGGCRGGEEEGVFWSAGKQRLMSRLIAEGFSLPASLRAISALSLAPPAPLADGGGEAGSGGGAVASVPRSTTKLVDCILWLCERLGDASVNAECSEEELALLTLTPADLPRLHAAAAEYQRQAEAAAEAVAAEKAAAASAKRVFYRDAAVEDAVHAAASAAAAKEAAAAVAANPWAALEKASEAAAEAAAKKARDEAAEKRRAKAQERGFNKGYKS